MSTANYLSPSIAADNGYLAAQDIEQPISVSFGL